MSSQRGEVIIVMHQYTGKGKTIRSSGQLEWYKQEVDDKSIKLGGKQRIKTLDGYVIPLDVKSGLPYVKMLPYTDKEWDSLPHVILTGDGDWNPSVLVNWSRLVTPKVTNRLVAWGNWRTPMEILTGSTPDISPLLSFRWWEPVYFKLDDASFPSDSREWRGRFVGISEHMWDMP
jgi:hypothetical protein